MSDPFRPPKSKRTFPRKARDPLAAYWGSPPDHGSAIYPQVFHLSAPEVHSEILTALVIKANERKCTAQELWEGKR